MKALSSALLLCCLGFGCARIYRPVDVAPAHPMATGSGLAAAVTLQPWGDNSGYEEKALKAHLRVLVLDLENGTTSDVEVLRLELPGDPPCSPPRRPSTL